jgi:glutaredoxin 3
MLKVYSKSNCPFCDRAKHLLTQKGIVYEEVRVDLDPDAREFIMQAGHRTVPQIYLGDQVFVEGGYQGLAKLDDSAFQQLKETINAN